MGVGGLARCVCLAALLWRVLAEDSTARRVLVFGGNGFLGSSVVQRLLAADYRVTIVNRGNWYWDSKDRILPRVDHVPCDREKDLETGCPELAALLAGEGGFHAVIDLSATGPRAVRQTASLLRDKLRLYVLVSSDAVYDVTVKNHDGFLRETDVSRPESKEDQEALDARSQLGVGKLGAEQALMAQRVEEGGAPFVIVRLPDVVGPRDTSHRWWMYQLWLKLASVLPDNPVTVPSFLVNYQMSLVYVEDVASTLVGLLDRGPEIKDQAVNLAYPETFTLESLLSDIRDQLGLDGPSLQFVDGGLNEGRSAFYPYPRSRRGPLDVSRAQSLLGWEPTPWHEVVADTARFFEAAFSDETFATQRDEVVQLVAHHVHAHDPHQLYETLENLYQVELHHFKNDKDEL